MNTLIKTFPAALALVAGTAAASAAEFEVSILADGLDSPTGIAVDSFRNIYFAEAPDAGVPSSNNAIKLLDRRGRITTIATGATYPVNVALDRSRNVFWTDADAGSIQRYDNRTRRVSRFLAGETLLSPSGISVSRANGDVFFTEVPDLGTPGANMVSVTDGRTIELISNNEPAPTDIVVGSDGTAYWTCYSAGVILERSPSGEISLLLSGLENPMGISLSPLGGRLYFTEIPTPGVAGPELVEGATGRNRVMEYNLNSGELSLVAGGFPYPMDVAAGSGGQIYWTCTVAGVIAVAEEIRQPSGGFPPSAAIGLPSSSGSSGSSSVSDSQSVSSGTTSASGTGSASGANPSVDIDSNVSNTSTSTAPVTTVEVMADGSVQTTTVSSGTTRSSSSSVTRSSSGTSSSRSGFPASAALGLP